MKKIQFLYALMQALIIFVFYSLCYLFSSHTHAHTHTLSLSDSFYRHPGFGLTLVSESTTGTTHAAESSSYSCVHTTTPIPVAPGSTTEKGGSGEEKHQVLPEAIGTQVASLLMEEIVKVQTCVVIIIDNSIFL